MTTVAQTSMVHVRVDDALKTAASAHLARFGLTVSDAVRILLARVVEERGLPVALASDHEAYDAWFRTKVQEALVDMRTPVEHRRVMDAAQSVIDRKRDAQARMAGSRTRRSARDR